MTDDFKKTMRHSTENLKVFNELLALCRNNMIVPYIGAGMSAFAGFIPNLRDRNLFPTWTSLIGAKYSEYFKDKALPKDLIDAADEIEKAMGKEDFYEYIRITMGGNLNEEWAEILKEAENQAISVIPKLFFCPMVTTNFDQIVERIYEGHEENISVSFPYHTENLDHAIGERRQLLYKIHGCVSDAPNIVLAKSKYDEVYDSMSDLVKLLSQFCQGFHFLFLGCSLTINSNDGTTDYSTKLLLDLQGKSKMPHYAILPCGKDNTIERRIELEKRNIYPIFYENTSGKHEEVKIILDTLKDEIKNQLFQLPIYNQPYTERKDNIVIKIKNKLKDSKYSVLALTGDGGVGKTRIIREYALQNKERYNKNNVFWFSTISSDNVREGVRQFVIEYQGISKEEKNTNKIFNAFREWIRTNDNYLFLLDNVENYEDINAFLYNDFSTSTGTRHILITSRLSENELNDIQVEEIKAFENEDARLFLQSHTDTKKYNEEYADKIANVLGYLPLALEQAAAIIQNEKKENEERAYEIFYEELEKEPLAQLERQHPEPGAVSVAATWNMAMQRISNNAAKEFLWLCAYFAPDNINSQWFVDSSEVLPEHLKNDIQTKLHTIKEQLKKYSLIKINNDKISIHRLLQGVILGSLEGKHIEYYTICVHILNKFYNEDFSTIEARTLFSEIVPHITSVITKIDIDDATTEIDRLFYFLGKGFYESADFQKSLHWHNQSLYIREHVLGKEDLGVAESYNEIGVVYDELGFHNKALTFCGKALGVYKKTRGEEHRDVAIIYNNIAGFYRNIGDQVKALKCYKKSMQIKENIFGEDDIRTATAYNNIAGSYRKLKKYDEALVYYVKALKIREHFDKEHPNTATTYNDIAWVYSALALHDRALECCEKALRIWKKVMGKRHPYVAAAYHTMGFVYDSQGNYDKALDKLLKSFCIYKDVLGEDHPKTIKIDNYMKEIHKKKRIGSELANTVV